MLCRQKRQRNARLKRQAVAERKKNSEDSGLVARWSETVKLLLIEKKYY